MAKLTAAARKRLKPGQFAGPDRSYPVEDASHARNALARASQQYKAGRLSKAQYDSIVSKARKALAKRTGRSVSDVLKGR